MGLFLTNVNEYVTLMCRATLLDIVIPNKALSIYNINCPHKSADSKV